MPYCEVAKDVRLYHEDFGDGPAIVFTPSGSQTHKMWENQVGALSGDHRCVAYDWRGTGASDKPRGGYTGEQVAADLCVLIERLGLAPAVLVAHGIGNHVTLMAAAARADLVAGIVLVSASPWFSGVKEGVAGGLAEEFLDLMGRGASAPGARGKPYPQICAELSENFLFHRPQSPAVHQSILAQALEWPMAVINSIAKTMPAIDHRERTAQVKCPALIVHGRHDRKVMYAGAAYLARRIAGARFLTLENSGHMGQIEEIETFNAALREFAEAAQGRKRAA